MLSAIGEGEIRFKRSGQQQLLVETLLVRFALLDRTVQLEDVLRAIGDGGASSRAASAGAGVTQRTPPDDMRSTAPRPSAPAPRNTAPGAPVARSPVDAALAREVIPESAASRPIADLNAIAGRWDELADRVRASGKALLGAALHASVPHAITRKGDLTIRLDEPNDFHARAIEQDAAAVQAVLSEWFEGVARIQVHRGDAPVASTKPQRVTDEMVKSERLTMLRRKDPVLDAAIDVLDLEIDD
jgi:DNA polymerase-3 subunit gamma/tau